MSVLQAEECKTRGTYQGVDKERRVGYTLLMAQFLYELGEAAVIIAAAVFIGTVAILGLSALGF